MERKPDWLLGFPVQIYCNRGGVGHDSGQGIFRQTAGHRDRPGGAAYRTGCPDDLYVDEEYENTTAFHNLFVPNMQETETVVIDNQLQFQLPKDVLDVDGIETSMLTLQGKARTDTSGITAPAGRVTAVYDTNLLVNGMRYNYAYDKPAVMIYTLDETQAAAADKLRYYAMDDAGTLTELTGVYNTADRTVTFSLENIQNFVVVNTAAAAPDDNPETGVGTAAGALALVAAAGAAVCVCRTKRKNR